MAILTEHCAGKWPFCISPRQIIIIPIVVNEEVYEYCESVYLYYHQKGYECYFDDSSDQLKNKVRKAMISSWNYILCAGEAEMKAGTVNVKTRDIGEVRVDEFVQTLE